MEAFEALCLAKGDRKMNIQEDENGNGASRNDTPTSNIQSSL